MSILARPTPEQREASRARAEALKACLAAQGWDVRVAELLLDAWEVRVKVPMIEPAVESEP